CESDLLTTALIAAPENSMPTVLAYVSRVEADKAFPRRSAGKDAICKSFACNAAHSKHSFLMDGRALCRWLMCVHAEWRHDFREVRRRGGDRPGRLVRAVVSRDGNENVCHVC